MAQAAPPHFREDVLAHLQLLLFSEPRPLLQGQLQKFTGKVQEHHHPATSPW